FVRGWLTLSPPRVMRRWSVPVGTLIRSPDGPYLMASRSEQSAGAHVPSSVSACFVTWLAEAPAGTATSTVAAMARGRVRASGTGYFLVLNLRSVPNVVPEALIATTR